MSSDKKKRIDTNKFRDMIIKSFSDSRNDGIDAYSRSQGIDVEPADDRDLFESVHPEHTVRHWGKWIYQKRSSGKWDRVAKSNKGKKG